VKGFPTLYLHTASGKIIPYEGNRNKDDFISFINKNKDTLQVTEALADVEVPKDEL
jgi:protein disulfide-isomerase A1